MTDVLLVDAGLQGCFDGEVVLPPDERYDEARRAWNLAADQRPAAVAYPESADDIAAIVRYARANGLRVTTQATGHFAGTLEPLERAILVRTERMRGVELDPEARVARAEAGALWRDVTVPAAAHGLAALAGSAPDVGVVGYTLGGGLGWLGRRHGLAANAVLALEVVTAEGRIVRADAEHEPELFWALRGGGGSFGIVTAIELRLLPIAEVFAGALFFPAERAAAVLHAYREWTTGLPEEVTSVGRLMQFPPFPEVPEGLRGRAFAIVEAAFLGGEAEGGALLEPLRALGPELDTFATIPAVELAHLHMDPPGPVPGIGDGFLLAELPAEAVDALVAVVGPGTDSPLLSVEIRHLGGALGRTPPSAGAAGRIDAAFAVFAVGAAISAEAVTANDARLEGLRSALAGWEAPTRYFNFAERAASAAELFPPETYERLQAVRAAVDPDERFLVTHGIPPAA